MSEESPEANTDTKKPAKHPEPKKPRGVVKRLLKGFLGFSWPILAFFVVSFSVTMIVLAIGFVTGQPMGELVQTNNAVRLTFQILVMIGVLLLVVLPLYRIFFRERTPLREVLGIAKKPQTSDLGWALLMYAGYLVATIVAFVVVSQFIPGVDLEESQELGVDAPVTARHDFSVFLTQGGIPALI
jgi:magnesium-transporting ATPase (P-type)